MARKKQQRRRAKERRHDVEYDFFDAEGNPITEEEYEALLAETGASPSSNGSSAAKPIQRGARTIHPPSWRRVFKRGLLFAPLMYLTLYFLSPESATPFSIAFSTAYLLALFIPFSYFMDRFMYRRFAAKKR